MTFLPHSLVSFRPYSSQSRLCGASKGFCGEVLGLLLFSAVFAASCSSVSVHPSDPATLDLQGHRGARGLRPENTWPAFQAAIENGMTTLELDTVLTKDGRLIVHHDSSTNPVICQNPDGTEIQKVSLYELTLADLKKLDCGSKKNPKFPRQKPVVGTHLITLEELFRLAAKAEQKRKIRLRFNIETKFPGDADSEVPETRMKAHVRALVSAIRKAGLEGRATIQSFYLPALIEAKQIAPRIPTSALFVPTYFQGFRMLLGLGAGLRQEILKKARAVGADIISPYSLYVTPEFVAWAHRYKLRVVPWTVNEPDEMERLLAAGVDGIISDYPDLLRGVVDRYKAKRGGSP